MTETIPAIFEKGVIRPLRAVSLNEGDEIEVLLLEHRPDPRQAYRVLQSIAGLQDDAPVDDFSGADHDSILYPASE